MISRLFPGRKLRLTLLALAIAVALVVFGFVSGEAALAAVVTLVTQFGATQAYEDVRASRGPSPGGVVYPPGMEPPP